MHIFCWKQTILGTKRIISLADMTECKAREVNEFEFFYKKILSETYHVNRICTLLTLLSFLNKIAIYECLQWKKPCSTMMTTYRFVGGGRTE